MLNFITFDGDRFLKSDKMYGVFLVFADFFLCEDHACAMFPNLYIVPSKDKL